MKLVIDDREHKRINEARQFYEEKGCEVTVQELPVGDFIFQDQVCFEYKTFPDLISSIIDGRVFNQSIDQYKDYPYHFVIIQASDGERNIVFEVAEREQYGFTKSQYYGAIARLNTYTTVLTVPTLTDAFELMHIQASKCLDQRPVKKHFNDKTDNMALTWLSGIKRIGDSTAETICDCLELKSLDDLMGLSLNDLTGIDGIGRVKAETILKTLR